MNNSHRGHGAAIHYSHMYNTNKPSHDQFVFTINNCNFKYNKHIKSLVYIENRLFKYHKVIFSNSTFISNQGICVYVINHKFYIGGKVLFQSNTAENGAGVYISGHSTVFFGKTSNVIFSQNSANNRGGAVFLARNSACIFDHNSIVVFYYNKATKGGAIYSKVSSTITFNASCKVTFNNNSATQCGAAIYSLNYSHVIFAGSSWTIFYGNNVQNRSYSSFGGIICSHNHCVITFEDIASTVFRNNTARSGGALYSNHRCHISFEENSTTEFSNNTADYGGAIVSYDNSYISLKGNSAIEFSDNTAKQGGAIYSEDNCGISFEGDSTTEFSNNTADYGGSIWSQNNCGISFEANSTTEFSNNTADYGGAILSYDNSYISFKGSSVTEFSNNIAKQGGAIYSQDNCSISFELNSSTEFSNNTADYGGSIRLQNNCHISLKGNSSTEFSDNTARQGGGIHSNNNCFVCFEENSTIEFSNNTADYGGSIWSQNNCHISFEGNSTTEFNSNAANYGGAILSYHNSYIFLQENSATEFSNNTAKYGGAVHSEDNCHTSLKGNSVTEFSDNTAKQGGAIQFQNNCDITFEGNSTIEFRNNVANLGGAILTYDNSYISFEGTSTTEFSNNIAKQGGAIHFQDNCSISFKSKSTAKFSSNVAVNYGGAISSNNNSFIFLQENSATKFSNNAAKHAGAIHSQDNCHISFEGNSTIEFHNNTAHYGGAILSYVNTYISFKGNSATDFSNNTANRGGAILSHDNSDISFKGNSTVEFINNTAADYGGAIFSHSNVFLSFEGNSIAQFSNNTSDKNGGAVFASSQCRITFNNNSTVFFTSNTASFDTTILCNYNSKITVKGNSSFIFNDLPAQWCFNTCLKYPDEERDAVTIDSSGMIWCSNQKVFICQSNKCHCNNLEDIIVNVRDNQIVNITDDIVTLSSAIHINSSNISIIGHNNPTVMCVNHSGLALHYCSNLTIEGITFIGCGATYGIYDIVYIDTPALDVHGCNNIRIQKCSFQYSMGQVITLQNVSGYVNINNCKFLSHTLYRYHGAAIYYESDDGVFDEFVISNCNFSSNKAKSVICFNYRSHGYNNTHLINSSFHNNEGVSVYLFSHQNLYIGGEILFENNLADNSAGIYISDHSTVMFGENSYIKFISNSVYHNGAAVFINNNSTAIFDYNSKVTFIDNEAGNGIIYSKASSQVIFKAACQVAFKSNLATQNGCAIYSCDNSQVIFKENARVTFNNNVISFDRAYLQHGGVMFSENNGNIVFEANSITSFSNNSGSAIFSVSNSNVIFKDNSRVTFNRNIAHYCGILTSGLFFNITFTDKTKVIYDTNTVSLTSEYDYSAGTIHTFQGSEIIFTKSSLLTFFNNKANRGAAMILLESNIIMEEHSTVIFNSNIALYSSGGAFVCSNNSNVTIKGNSNVTFNNNKASQSGGAIHSYNMCRIVFKENSTATFVKNTARDNGGALFSGNFSDISFEGNSAVIFDGNTADNGGVFYFTNSVIIFKESSVISFNSNEARQYGGVGYFNFNSQVTFAGIIIVRFDNNTAEKFAGVIYSARSNILFKENCTISVANNKATFGGGALYVCTNSDVSFTEFANITFQHNRAFYGGAILDYDHSNITVTENSVLIFTSNEAIQSGGAGYFNYSCNFISKESTMVKFYYNKAIEGGAVYIKDKTKFMVTGKSIVSFNNNLATASGGAVKLVSKSNISLDDHINISFIDNNAQYGGAIFLDTTAVMVNNSYKNCINFKNNIAQISGNSVYQDAAKFCNSSCLINRTVNINSHFVTTPPNELRFCDPAICIDNDQNVIQCRNYYIQDVMLGTEIVMPACVLDYYDQPIDSTQFLVQSEMHSSIFISGPKQTLISCDTFKGISIMSNKVLLKITNFSINITLNIALNSKWKKISVNLSIELSPCHPGFWQYPKSTACECYNASDIVFCSGSSSTIKRGYWFGSVTGKPTITFCPVNYCNFTCCETSNGYYHLSPVRDNQCRSHRSGAACGSCEVGYTLSFDSVECVHVNECSIGWTILVLALVVIYWIIIIAAVFSLMYFKVGIGYLYAITYYYSVVDLLLSQNWYNSNALYTTTIVMSSVAKITPQFFGQFCFITNMSGIDQQFIHYIHPVAISLFLVVITLLARRSPRLSSFISKGIIHAICCLLLLSYTSLATTSLLLMRPLTFYDVDKVYTYVSPDVEYFHGRHLVYGIVAVLFTIVIVIGLPLLLTLEPFLNSKINFIKIKPLLDQFQGCYKDRYRCFAAYYMICRLIIITIIIANSSNDDIFQYLLISTFVIIDLAHQIFRPYSSCLLNIFDGAILHFLVLVSALPQVDSFSNLNFKLAMGITVVLVILPLLIFITMSLMINKEMIKKLPGYCYLKYSQLCLYRRQIPLNEIPLLKTEEDEYINIIDDNRRQNATICDV